MSLITDDPESSPRDCSRKHHRRHRQAVIGMLSTVSSLLLLVLILWLTLRPASPRFTLLAATATATDKQNATDVIVVDATFTAHNPNAHATALYDQLHASASYAGVLLGAGAPMPPLEQPDAGDVVLSALLTWPSSSGMMVPGGGGRALLRVRIEGQLRWRVAAWVSGRHGLTVECVAAVVLLHQAGVAVVLLLLLRRAIAVRHSSAVIHPRDRFH